MKRREFLRKATAAAVATSLVPQMLKADDSFSGTSSQQPEGRADDFEILSDKVRDGVRYVSAKTSAKVCSESFDLQIRVKDQVLLSYVCNRGCPGNSIGIGRLVKNMKVDDVISTLSGTPCGKRGTSCPDQLARILTALK